MTTRWIILAATVAIGCGGRQHLSEHHGKSYRAAFEAQATPRPDGPARAAAGLDSQEAAIVSQTYRASLAPQDQKPRDQPILVVSPPSRDLAAPQKLAPSVPQER